MVTYGFLMISEGIEATINQGSQFVSWQITGQKI